MSALPIVLRSLLPPVIVLAVLAGIGWVLLWLAFTPQSFGGWDPRVLFFVRGTWTDRIGIIEPESGSRHYEAEAPDGPGVGYLRTSYRTKAAADAALAAFAAGCGRLGLGVMPPRDDAPPPKPGEKFLVCSKGDLTIGMKVAGQDVFVWEDIF